VNYYCYTEGKILRKSQIKVGITDLVLLRGYGVFDYMRTYYGHPFRINSYLQRFEQSAKGMKLKLPLTRKEMITVINKLLEKNRQSSVVSRQSSVDVGIRLLLTGGYSLDSYLPAAKPNLFILIEDLPTLFPPLGEGGIKLMLHEHAREMPLIKTTNYLTAIHLADERRKHLAQDTLYCSGGRLLETTRNNFFLFFGSKLVTPLHHVLLGVTRNVVLELAKKNFKVEERTILTAELNIGTECFITGTTRGITPVVQIGEKKIGKGGVGENTKALMKLFKEAVERECKIT